VPLEKRLIVNGSDNAIRLSSADGAVAAMPAPAVAQQPEAIAPAPVEPVPPVQEASPSATVANGTGAKNGIAALLADAESIKELLRQAYTQTTQLVAGVKRYRKQAQVVRSALGSLRQFQDVAE
jgi:hypothetical protein